MIINNRVKLGNKNYYIRCDCVYKKKEGSLWLCLKDYKSDYYDGGDLRLLIERIEKNYNKDTYKKYDDFISFISDALYIYDNIPFISGVGDYYISEKDKQIYSISYITKEELDDIIKSENIKMQDMSGFVLADQRTWKI